MRKVTEQLNKLFNKQAFKKNNTRTTAQALGCRQRDNQKRSKRQFFHACGVGIQQQENA